MEIWRGRCVEFLDELLQRLFLFGRAFQLKHQVLHLKAVINRAAVILSFRFGVRIPMKRDQLAFVDALGDLGALMPSAFDLCACTIKGKEQPQYDGKGNQIPDPERGFPRKTTGLESVGWHR